VALKLVLRESQALLGILGRIEAEIQPREAISEEHLGVLEQELVTVAQKPLKEEWKVVRDGEPVYRLTKYITLAIVSAGMFTEGVLVIRV